mgnify:CR=1 FL=1
MAKNIERRIERIERQLGTEQEMTLFPDFDNPGEYIEVAKDFFRKLLEAME